MANMDEIDRFSNLPDDLLLTIISLLPTHITASTSVLCRRFRHLWEASPSLNLTFQGHPHSQYKNFVFLAKRVLLDRNASHPLLNLHLKIWVCDRNVSFVSFRSSLLAKARSLDLRHLTIEGFCFSYILPILPIIFTINSLGCLSLIGLLAHVNFENFNFPSRDSLTCLRRLSLRLYETNPIKLNQLISELCSLEDLHLDIQNMLGLSLSSHTIKNLKLIIDCTFQKLDVELSLPSLESLHLETFYVLHSLSTIRVKVPLLRKVVIDFGYFWERDISVVARLLNCISHVEELSRYINESELEKYPIPVLWKIGRDMLHFSKLKHLHVTLCFHEHNLEAITTMLLNCPVLESLKLVHEVPMFMSLEQRRKIKEWKSKLPCNADGNNYNAYFRNLHTKENRKEVIKLLFNECSSKRQASSTCSAPQLELP